MSMFLCTIDMCRDYKFIDDVIYWCQMSYLCVNYLNDFISLRLLMYLFVVYIYCCGLMLHSVETLQEKRLNCHSWHFNIIYLSHFTNCPFVFTMDNINWELCCLCQSDTYEQLQTHRKEGLLSLDRVTNAFKEMNASSCCIAVTSNQLNDGSGIAAITQIT